MNAQIIPLCTRKCKAWELPAGDSKHFLDCTIWPWNDHPAPRPDPSPSDPAAVVSVVRSTSLERYRTIAVAVCYSSLIVTLIALLALYLGVWKP